MTQLQDAAASDHPSPLDMEQAKDKFFHEQVIDLTKWALSETDALHNKILKAGLSSQLAMAYGNIGQWGEAFDTVNTIFEITPHLPEGYLCESQLYLMQGYIPRAVDSINKGLEQIPNDDATLQHQAMLLSSYQHQQQEQQFDKKQYYDSIIENTTWTLDADSPSMTPDITMRLYKLRAVTYGKIYQFTKAFKDADTLSDLFSDIPDVFLCYGQLYWIQGFKRRALEKIDEGLIQFPDDPRLKREAAVLLQQLRRVDIFATAPLEITDRIIAYLDPIKHVLSPSPSLLSVSKTWRSRILNCVSLWSTVNTFDFYVDDEESVLRAIDQFCYVLPLVSRYINKLVIRAGPNVKQYSAFIHEVKKGSFTNLRSLSVNSTRWDVWNMKRLSNGSMLRVLQHIGPQLTRLDVIKPHTRSNSILQNVLLIFSLCPNLKTLCVEENAATWTHDTDNEVEEEESPDSSNDDTLLATIAAIQQQQSTSNINNNNNLPRNTTALDKLYLVGRGIENQALESILQRCPDLKFFELHGHSHDQGEIAGIIQRHCRNLYHFGLNTAISDNDERLKQLTSYFHSSERLHKVKDLEDHQGANNFNGPQLKYLYSTHYMNRLPTQLALISAYSNTLKGLKLSMDKDPFHRMDVDPSTVIQQLTFPVLRKLSIIVRRNTHQVVASLLRRCPALEHAVIELDHTYKSDGILSSMTADYLPRIEQLDLVAQKDMEVGCDELTLILESHHRRAFNNPISTGVPQSFLRKVSLSCFTISSSSDLLVLLASLPKMEAIVLSDLTVSKETMDDFANTLITASESSSSTTSLKQLSLIRLQDALTDDTIGVFCSIPTLKSLELQRIFRITDKCAQHFVKAASHLERLVVQRCPLISVDSLNQAKESGVKHVVFSSMLLRRRTGQTTLLM